jgi:hypothetical protein
MVVAVFPEVLLSARGDDDSPLADWTFPGYPAMSLEQLLTHFQAAGYFRPDSGSPVMALGTRGVIGPVPPRLARYANLDVGACARELAGSPGLAAASSQNARRDERP